VGLSKLAQMMGEPIARKETTFCYNGVEIKLGTDDPARVAGELLMADADDLAKVAAHLSVVTGKAVKPETVGQARQILAVWADDEPTGEKELVETFQGKPELFLALHKAADDLLTVDPVLMTYVTGNARAPQALRDAANALVGTGLKNSDGATGS
jgi:hypothetical protein